MQHEMLLWKEGGYLLGTFGPSGIDFDQTVWLLSSRSQTIHNIFIEQHNSLQKDDIKHW